MKCDRKNFFVILNHFLLFYPTNNPKTQNFEKMNKNVRRSSFYISVPKIMVICYTVPEIWRVTDVICIYHFRLFFALLPPPPLLIALTPQKIPKSFEKMKKSLGDIIILHMCTKNYDEIMYGS